MTIETARLLGERGLIVPVDQGGETLGHKAEQALRDGGADATFVHLDVTDGASIEQAAVRAKTAYDRFDVPVNNASVTGGEANTVPSRTSRQEKR
ncbi:SDR family NAD(P)-dependent oxidoreductase [Streptomyces sp. NPDC006372]|uniref:SDR family NAD(P)-dependent oxidoreductase n=1 Tax=Streptomyces sp. NPDC006372 TaxID=3155599 RepID=UPI0033BCA2D3